MQNTSVENKLQLRVGLSIVIVAVKDNMPKVFIIRKDKLKALPFGNFDPAEHSTLEKGLLSWVEDQTPIKVRYLEQLYTFSNKIRYTRETCGTPYRFLSIGYLALTDQLDFEISESIFFNCWYRFFPWEDWREGEPKVLSTEIIPELRKWSNDDKEKNLRVDICFGQNAYNWGESKTLQRYELLYEAKLVAEYYIDNDLPIPENIITSEYMDKDHRRILATAIGRLRRKLKYKPVIYELMPEEFTLLKLQNAVETLMGKTLHKQNFRRLVESSGMVEPIEGKTSNESGGRPAALFRFKRDVAFDHFI